MLEWFSEFVCVSCLCSFVPVCLDVLEICIGMCRVGVGREEVCKFLSFIVLLILLPWENVCLCLGICMICLC